ncbi:MAG: hypothetical protein ACYTF6_01145 [Planctomycetota bacterium]|jgi:hypothetical protein
MLPVTSILLIFYLVMLFKLGAVGLLLVFVGDFFVVGGAEEYTGLRTVEKVLDAAGSIVAFVCAFISCFGAALPGVDRPAYTQQPPQPAQPPTPPQG